MDDKWEVFTVDESSNHSVLICYIRKIDRHPVRFTGNYRLMLKFYPDIQTNQEK